MKELALNILDIANNSIRAKCTLLEIIIEESENNNILTIEIKDNGCGMSAETLKRVTDPFYSTRKTRHIGLGIPFLKLHAELAGGNFAIESTENVGTTVFASFLYNHPDRQPLGDVPDIILMLIASDPQVDYYYKYTTDYGEVEFDTREVKKVLEDININDPEVIKILKDMMIIHKND
ncbi:MAG: ATP-binding protein [Bacteroidales bacterium]|jgi:anti-sigma regulatory factor (Ser/Thr protein kinase)